MLYFNCSYALIVVYSLWLSLRLTICIFIGKFWGSPLKIRLYIQSFSPKTASAFLYADGQCVTNSSWLPSPESVHHYRTAVRCHFSYSGRWMSQDVEAAIRCHASSGPGKITHHQSTSQSFSYSKTISWQNADDIASFNCTVNAVEVPTQHLLTESSMRYSFVVIFHFRYFNYFSRRLLGLVGK